MSHGHLPNAESAAVLEGWKLVPVEPTLEMKEAALIERANDRPTGNIWRAMLAAAPQPPAERAAVPPWSGVKVPADTWAGNPVVDPPLTHAGYGGAVPAQVVGWLYDRIGSELNPHFVLAGPQADRQRCGIPGAGPFGPVLLPDSSCTNWRPLCAVGAERAALTAQPAAPSTPEGQKP